MKQQKTRRANTLFTLAALVVVLMCNLYVGRAIEPDPRVLWVADSALGRVDGFAVHPNGNIFSHRNGIVSEIDGKTGKLIRTLPAFGYKTKINSIDIAYDGKFMVTSTDGVIVTELVSGIFQNIGNGNEAVFLPNSYKVAFRANKTHYGIVSGHDSSIVILDIESGERRYVKTEEMITKIAFSPDGRFMATAGSREKNDGSFYTTLKLWDTTTLTLIKELVRYENQNYQIAKIQFSPDNNLVAFFGDMGLTIFDIEKLNIFKHYTNSSFGLDISRFTFIGSEYIGIQSEKTSILRFSNDTRIDIYEFPTRAFMMETNKNNSILYAGTGYLGNSIIAFDLKQIFSDVKDSNLQLNIQTKYHDGVLNITGFVPINDTLAIEIFDINGKIMNRIEQQVNGIELRIPIVLPIGIYLLNLKDGNKEYSTKFMVTE